MAVPEEVKEIIRLQAEHVKDLRFQLKDLQDVYGALEKQFEATNSNQILLIAQTKAELEIAEADLRQEAIEAFVATGEKRPGPGVEVKIYDILSYNPTHAFEWA